MICHITDIHPLTHQHLVQKLNECMFVHMSLVGIVCICVCDYMGLHTSVICYLI